MDEWQGPAAGDEPEAKVLAGGEGPNDDKVKEVMRKIGLPKLYKQIAVYEKEMAAGGPGGQGLAHLFHFQLNLSNCKVSSAMTSVASGNERLRVELEHIPV